MKLLISQCGHKTKPAINYYEINQLSNYSTYTQIGVRTFAQLCADGHTWIPAEFKPEAKTRKKADAIGANAIGIDIDDSTIPPEEFVAYAESVGLVPNFYYYTFSQDPALIQNPPEDYIVHKSVNYDADGARKENYRYRVVWLFDETIPVKTFNELVLTLMEVTFKDYSVDKACKDICRLFYGSNTYAVVVNPEPTKLASMGWAKVMEVSAQGKENRTVHNQKKAGAQDWEEIEVPEAITVDVKWMDKLRPYCDLLDKWMNGEYIDYNQRLTLWSNLRFIKRNNETRLTMNDLMQYVRPSVYENHTFSRNEIAAKFRDEKLKPAPIVKYKGERMSVVKFFSEYSDAAIETKKDDYCTLEELDAWMDTTIPKVLNERGFTYFKSQTASGKTERIIQTIVKESFRTNKIIYAVPTHALAKEIEARLKRAAADSASDLAVYRVPEGQYTDIELLLLRLGIQVTLTGSEKSTLTRKIFEESVTGVFIITHSLLVNLGGDIPVDKIIVDENIEDALIDDIKIKTVSLRKVLPFIPADERYLLEDYLEAVEQNTVIGTELPDDIKNIILKINQDDYIAAVREDSSYCIPNLFSILKADKIKFSYDGKSPCIRALKKSSLIDNAMQNDIPIKLFTATPMSQRLKNYYGLDFKIVEPTKPANNQGNVNAYRGNTGARGVNAGDGMDVAKFNKLDKYIKSKLSKTEIKHSVVISFKGSEKLWVDAGYTVAVNTEGEHPVVHLMNNAGLDCFKGQNIIVAGKYDKPDIFYYDLWSDIKPEGDTSVPHREKQKIFRNGIWQTLFLWDKEELRNEQLEYMEYATQQAIGRARALRTDANVHLFSNYVPEGIDKIFD